MFLIEKNSLEVCLGFSASLWCISWNIALKKCIVSSSTSTPTPLLPLPSKKKEKDKCGSDIFSSYFSFLHSSSQPLWYSHSVISHMPRTLKIVLTTAKSLKTQASQPDELSLWLWICLIHSISFQQKTVKCVTQEVPGISLLHTNCFSSYKTKHTHFWHNMPWKKSE